MPVQSQRSAGVRPKKVKFYVTFCLRLAVVIFSLSSGRFTYCPTSCFTMYAMMEINVIKRSAQQNDGTCEEFFIPVQAQAQLIHMVMSVLIVYICRRMCFAL